MNRYQKDPYLAEIREGFTQLGAEELRRFRRSILDTLRDVALVTREIQAPPICVVDCNAVDQTLTVTTDNVLPFVTTRTGAIDTHGWWSNSTYRYTPKETGYYQCSLHFTLNYPTTGLVSAGNVRSRIRKNGTGEVINRLDTADATAIVQSFSSSKIIYCNGSDDYLDFVVTYSAGSGLTMLGAYNQSYGSIAFIGGTQVP